MTQCNTISKPHIMPPGLKGGVRTCLTMRLCPPFPYMACRSSVFNDFHWEEIFLLVQPSQFVEYLLSVSSRPFVILPEETFWQGFVM